MVKYCDGFLCKKKKKRGRVWRYLNGVSNTKLSPLTNPNNVVITNTPNQPIDPMIAAFGNSEKFITKDGTDAAWNAVTGIGQTVLEGVGYAAGIPIISAFTKMVQNLKRFGYTAKVASKAAQVILKHKLPNVFGRNPSAYSSLNLRKAMRKGMVPKSNLPIRVTPTSVSPFPTPASSASSTPLKLGLRKKTLGQLKHESFMRNRSSKVPNRADSATARKARYNAYQTKNYLPFDNAARQRANEFNAAVGDPYRFPMSIQKISARKIGPLVKLS